MYLEFLDRKNDYIKASRRAFEAGLAAGTGGNISVRLPGDRMLVKPSGITLGEAGEENLIITDFAGNLTEGTRKPTKETLLHGELYRSYPFIGAVVHVHPVCTIAAANRFDRMELVTKQMKQIMDVPVPVCKIKNNTIDAAGMEMIRGIFRDHPGIPCFLLEEHGLVAVGKTAVEACYAAELAEENAKVFWAVRRP